MAETFYFIGMLVFAFLSLGLGAFVFVWRSEAHKMRDRWQEEAKRATTAEDAREIAAHALTSIATGKSKDVFKTADDALRRIGLKPFHVTENCPPDTIYFLPKGMAPRPTDYF